MAPIRSSEEWTAGNYINRGSKCKAVVACDGEGRGCVLWYDGYLLEMEIQEGGLRDLGDLGLDNAPEGISVWEGTIIYSKGCYEYPNEVDSYLEGKFRVPNADEWAAIQKCEKPWAVEEVPEEEFVSNAGARVTLKIHATPCPTPECTGVLGDEISVITSQWFKRCPTCEAMFYAVRDERPSS